MGFATIGANLPSVRRGRASLRPRVSPSRPLALPVRPGVRRLLLIPRPRTTAGMSTAGLPSASSFTAASRWQRLVDSLAQPSRKVCAWAVIIVVVLGSGYRLTQYLPNRSFWRDEAYLLLNVMDKPADQLMGRLDHAQTAPPLFLLVERGLYLKFGAAEWAMRLVPLSCGIVGLCLFALLAWKALEPGPAFWAVVFFAFCDELVFHSISMKQYSGDAMATTILLLLGIAVLRSARPGLAFVGMAAAAMGLAWCSLTIVFVFAGLSLALLPAACRWPRRGIAWWLVGNALFGLSLAVLHHVVLRRQANPWLFEYWSADLADYSRPSQIPLFIIRETYRLCEVPCRAVGPLTLLLVLAGGWFLWRSHRRTLLGMLVGPILMTILAACLRQYPYHGGRVTVFLLPCVMILMAFGLQAAMSLPGTLGRLWWLPGLPMLLIGVGEAGPHVVDPMSRSHIRPAVQYIQAHRQSGEAIYLIGEGRQPTTPAIGGDMLELYCYWRHPEAPVHENMPADVSQIPYRRFWVTFAFLPRHGGTKYLDPLLKQIREVADEKDRLVVKEGGAAFLFEKR